MNQSQRQDILNAIQSFETTDFDMPFVSFPIIPVGLEKQNLDYLQTAYLNGKKVFESDEGRLHLKFTRKMAEKMYSLIK